MVPDQYGNYRSEVEEFKQRLSFGLSFLYCPTFAAHFAPQKNILTLQSFANDLNTLLALCLLPSRSFRAPHRTNVDNVLHDALKNWLIAESKTPGGGYMSQARSSSPLPTYRCTSGLSTIRSWRERTQEASRFLAEIVRDASNPHATLT